MNMKPATAFQQRILDYLETAPNRMASASKIGSDVFPEKWANQSAHGGLIAQIRKAGEALVATGRLEAVIPPKTASHTLWLSGPLSAP